MKIEQKQNKIKEFCDKTKCTDCPLKNTGRMSCWSRLEYVEENYAILFGEDTETKEKMPDNVNHPKHYESGKFECIDVMCEAIGLEDTKGFCLCNAFKYIYRCTKKHKTPTEDVKKAIWYLNKFLELEGENND